MKLPLYFGDRFIKKFEVDYETGCWNWIGAKYKNGYGCMRFNKFLTGAHRLSMAFHKNFDYINDKRLVLHKCDNKSCVNPSHLFLGNKSDNAMDMVNKGFHPGDLKTHCKNGHKYTKENTYTYYKKDNLKPYRRCKICKKGYNNGK